MQNEEQLDRYESPRISSEVLECSMPLTFDTYNNCGHNCTYCFSQYIRGTGPSQKNYDKKLIKAVDVQRIKDIFTLKKEMGYSDYIRNKITLQWGGLSDPFCPYEKRYGRGLELLKFFNEIKYPISFSSKGDLVLTDKRYYEEFKKAGDLWHYKATIITNDEEKAKLVEKGVPSPARRFEVLKELGKLGVKTTLRMRPFIIGLTDKTLEEMIAKAKEVGCQSATTEFFCLDTRGLGRCQTVNNYVDISKAIGFDILSFYKKYTGGRAGYIRLDKKFKKTYLKKFIAICEKYKLPWFCSDSDFKHKNPTGNCCGMLDSNAKLNNWAKLQVTHLYIIARKKGYITFEDALTCGENIQWRKNLTLDEYMNLGDCSGRGRYGKMTYYDYFLKSWNDLKWSNNLYKTYGEVLKPKGKDKNGNYIYYFDYSKDQL